jgi:trans-aconitate methyltransferase
MAEQAQAAAHWAAAYARGDETRSWYEEHPDMSLRMLGAAGVSAADALIDVGGGASPLIGALLDRGFGDLTVLDISAAGMQHARDRLGPRADQVHCLTADVLSWHPRRPYQAWHDRAVCHFLTTEEHRQQYLRLRRLRLHVPGLQGRLTPPRGRERQVRIPRAAGRVGAW